MKPYPLVIKYGDFALDTPTTRPRVIPRLHLTKSTVQEMIRNGVSNKSCGPTELYLLSRTTKVGSKKFHTTSDKPTHADINDKDTSRFCFAPSYEDVWIIWKHKSPELIKESKLELFCQINGKLTKIWTKTFTWDDCPEQGKTRFQGNLTLFDKKLDERANKGLRDVKIDYDKDRFKELFPGDCLTAQFSTYKLKLTVTPKSQSVVDAPKAIWMYFDVLVHAIDLEWGDVSLLPKKRDDIDPIYTEKILGKDATQTTPKVVGFEEKVLLDLKDTSKGGHAKPAPGTKHKVILTSNLFTIRQSTDIGNPETLNFTDFTEYKKLWGNGARIPLLAKVSIKTSDQKGTYKAPEALMGGRLLWDWEDDSPTRWSDAVTNGETPKFTKDFLDAAYHKDKAVKPINNSNCPKSFGGKSGIPEVKQAPPVKPNSEESEESMDDSNPKPTQTAVVDSDPTSFIFPEQKGTDVFPYEVKPCETRKWSAFSFFKPAPDDPSISEDSTTKENRCQTGVIFQPARLAGDKYKINVCFDFTPALDSEDPLDAPNPVIKEAGEFEVFRRVNLKYMTHGSPNLGCNANSCLSQTAQLYLKEANLILDYVPSPMDADFKTVYQKTKEAFLSNKDSYEKVGSSCWPLLFEYFIDENVPPGSSPIKYKELDDALRDLEDAFKNGQIFEYTNVDARKPYLRERVVSQSGAVGFQIVNDPDLKEKNAIFVKPGGAPFLDQDVVTGDASKKIGSGKIAIEAKPSFWGVTYSPDETSTDKKYVDTIDVFINGTLVPIKYSRKGFKRYVSTELSSDAKSKLKQALNNCDKSTSPTIKFKSKDTPLEDDKERLEEIKKFVKDSVIDRKAWLDYIKIAKVNAIPANDAALKESRLYDTFPLAFISTLITEYIKLKYPEDDGIFLYHIPGRTNMKDLAVAPINKPFKEPDLLGGNFPDVSKRNQGIVYISTLPAGPTVKADPSKKMEAIFAHEIAHAMFLPHALNRNQPGGGGEEKKHVKGDTCVMNYDLDSNRFCGVCMIRLRGWKTEPVDYNLGAEKFEYKIAIEIGDINTIFQEDVNTPKGRQERMQVLGLLNYPLDHPDINACYTYSWQKCEQLFPALVGASDSVIRSVFETEIKKMLVGPTGVLPAEGQFARIRVPTFTTMYSLNHLEARIPEADQGKPQSAAYERLMLSSNRFSTEEYFYTANPALGRIPLRVKVKMRRKDSGLDWSAAPEAKCVDVYFKLVKPDDFSAAAGPATVNVAGGISHYNNMAAPPLKDKPKAFILNQATTEPMTPTAPDAANAPTRFGGKRDKSVFRNPKIKGDDGLINIDVPKMVTDDNGVIDVFFEPSRIGGDAYKLCLYVGAPTQERNPIVVGKDGTVILSGPDVVTTGTMVRWRTIRISNHYMVNNSTDVNSLPAYLKLNGKPTSDVHKKHYGALPQIDLKGHVTQEFAKAYCEILLESAALNALPLTNEEANIRLTMHQLLASYPKYNNYSSVNYKAGGQKYSLNILRNKLTEDPADKTRRTFIGKASVYPLELGSLSVRPLVSSVDPTTLKKSETTTDVERAVLIDKDCLITDNGKATGKEDIESRSINYATGDIRIVFREQQQRNYEVCYKPVNLIDPSALLRIPFPPQTPYLVNLRLPDDYNGVKGANFPSMEKDKDGNLPKGTNHYLMIDSSTLGLAKALYLDSIARGIKLNNGYNPGLIIVQAQWLDNLTAIGDPTGTQEGKAVGQTVFLFTGAPGEGTDWAERFRQSGKDEANRYKALTIHEMSHALYLQHAPSETEAAGVQKMEHEDYPGETCVMSYGKNDGDHCGKCVASLRGFNIRNI